jgi:hypothetical protein
MKPRNDKIVYMLAYSRRRTARLFGGAGSCRRAEWANRDPAL